VQRREVDVDVRLLTGIVSRGQGLRRIGARGDHKFGNLRRLRDGIGVLGAGDRGVIRFDSGILLVGGVLNVGTGVIDEAPARVQSKGDVLFAGNGDFR